MKRLGLFSYLCAKVDDIDSSDGTMFAALGLIVILVIACCMAAAVVLIVAFSVSALVGWVTVAGMLYQAVTRLWRKVNS